MATDSNDSRSWSFEVSSFMILLGEDEERQYRTMQRSLPECLCAAPVAGLQSYLKSFATIPETSQRTYFAPYEGRTKILRNLRLARAIDLRKCLKDGRFSGYRVTLNDKGKGVGAVLAWQLLWSALTWVFFALIMASTIIFTQMTWIGISNCAFLTGWSIFVRMSEYICLRVLEHRETSNKEEDDAMFLLGRRNSCFLLEGNRGEISRWCDWDLSAMEGPVYSFLDVSVRIGSLMLLLYIFMTMPNGSTFDQVAFICINTVGQINVWLGQQLNSLRCLAAFEVQKHNKADAEWRTNVLGTLLRKFGNGPWVDDLAILPAKSTVWTRWRSEVLESREDPKKLWDRLREEELKEGQEITPDNAHVPVDQNPVA